MELLYLKKMEKTPTIEDIDNEGISEEQITEIEQSIGKIFPSVFREFLFLGGNEANMIGDMDQGCFVDGEPYWKGFQEECKEEMKNEDVKPKKDFWSFASLDGGEQFYFFYFFDGEDPKVHFYCSYLDDKDANLYSGIEDPEYQCSKSAPPKLQSR
ncbi:MAG: SMI1/KNR4 family protein [Ferruginibacter sp.]